MDNREVKKLVKESLKNCPIGKEPKDIQNAKDFYKYMFTKHPDLRKYFKGAENFDAEAVQKSERFDKQGQRIILAMYVCADTYDDEAAFRAYARETVNRHRQFKLDPALWEAFWTVFANFLETKGELTEEQRKAWLQLGETFNDECQSHLKALGLPHN
ncbi:unnamed protein product [Cylicocyclus nassatus]|uniref:Globin domain-containing protein n=1 Tax=Cylicocyclus nassatus TaxID=53992 RepID=A0AA36GK56_CYLNA|nr:unnamed protein product [Cylicocyclus nassatus]